MPLLKLLITITTTCSFRQYHRSAQPCIVVSDSRWRRLRTRAAVEGQEYSEVAGAEVRMYGVEVNTPARFTLIEFGRIFKSFFVNCSPRFFVKYQSLCSNRMYVFLGLTHFSNLGFGYGWFTFRHLK